MKKWSINTKTWIWFLLVSISWALIPIKVEWFGDQVPFPLILFVFVFPTQYFLTWFATWLWMNLFFSWRSTASIQHLRRVSIWGILCTAATVISWIWGYFKFQSYY